jgi:Uma2 family endonuclease
MRPQLDVPQTWTYDELVAYLESLPHDVDPRNYEIVDGALVVTPSPDVDHEIVSEGVRAAIRAALESGYTVIGPIDIDLNPTYRAPDLVVVPTALFGTCTRLVGPSHVRLVVEVVSPSSVTTDRITKPAQYAAAGIPAYWRVETSPVVSLTAYTLAAGAAVYSESGTWSRGQIARLREPFAIEIPIDQLTPRR